MTRRRSATGGTDDINRLRRCGHAGRVKAQGNPAFDLGLRALGLSLENTQVSFGAGFGRAAAGYPLADESVVAVATLLGAVGAARRGFLRYSR